jgi:hypothetical protein
LSNFSPRSAAALREQAETIPKFNMERYRDGFTPMGSGGGSNTSGFTSSRL